MILIRKIVPCKSVYGLGRFIVVMEEQLKNLIKWLIIIKLQMSIPLIQKNYLIGFMMQDTIILEKIQGNDIP